MSDLSQQSSSRMLMEQVGAGLSKITNAIDRRRSSIMQRIGISTGGGSMTVEEMLKEAEKHRPMSAPVPKAAMQTRQLTPEEAAEYYVDGNLAYARAHYPDECAAMSFYENLAVQWVRHHPAAKAKLAALSLQLLWQPTVIETGNPGTGTTLDVGRHVIEPAYMVALYVLAAGGLFLAPRPFVALALLLLAYQSACAVAFVGATRYRIAWDFLVALLATAALARGWEWAQARRGRREPVQTA